MSRVDNQGQAPKESVLVNRASEAIRKFEALLWVDKIILRLAENSTSKNPFIVINQSHTVWPHWDQTIWILDPKNRWYEYNKNLVLNMPVNDKNKKEEAQRNSIDPDLVWYNHIWGGKVYPSKKNDFTEWQRFINKLLDVNYFKQLLQNIKINNWKIIIKDQESWCYIEFSIPKSLLPDEDQTITQLKWQIAELQKLSSLDYKPGIVLPDHMSHMLIRIMQLEQDIRTKRIEELSSLIEIWLIALKSKQEVLDFTAGRVIH